MHIEQSEYTWTFIPWSRYYAAFNVCILENEYKCHIIVLWNSVAIKIMQNREIDYEKRDGCKCELSLHVCYFVSPSFLLRSSLFFWYNMLSRTCVIKLWPQPLHLIKCSVWKECILSTVLSLLIVITVAYHQNCQKHWPFSLQVITLSSLSSVYMSFSEACQIASWRGCRVKETEIATFRKLDQITTF